MMRPNDPRKPKRSARRILRFAVFALTLACIGLAAADLYFTRTGKPEDRIVARLPRPLEGVDGPQTQKPAPARPDGVNEPPIPESRAGRAARQPLPARLAENGFKAGDPVFIRIFKESSELEIWMKDTTGWRLFDAWPICRWSGTLGPKLKEGDGQSPEGFYTVTRSALNPNSNYHLSFNLGFPNAYDKAHGRSGSFLMVHGNCLSIGCYAMTDAGIDEIYGLVEAALDKGQRDVPVHIFPFRMTDGAMRDYALSEWADYWRNLKAGHDLFEAKRIPPIAATCGKAYVFATDGTPRCAAGDG